MELLQLDPKLVLRGGALCAGGEEEGGKAMETGKGRRGARRKGKEVGTGQSIGYRPALYACS